MLRFGPKSRALLLGLVTLVPGQWSYGFLGSFEEADGYRIPLTGQISSGSYAGDAQFYLNNNAANGYTQVVPLGAYPNTMGDGDGGWHGPDVSRYNAGQYGTTNGGPGGTAQDIPDNSGLWQALAGGRLNEDAAAPYYYGSQLVRDHIVAYHYLYSRTGSQSLNVFAAESNLRYSYALDSRDLGGMNPTATANALVQMSFWVTPTDWDDDDTGNIMGLSLHDAMNQSLVEVGYTGDNYLQYRLPGVDGAWQTTGYKLGTTNWSEITVAVDALANTASLMVRAYSDTLASLQATVVVLNGANLGVDADALTSLVWDVRGGTLDNGAASYIHYFDDFSFAVTPGVPVPEPGSTLLAALGLLWLSRRRR